MPINDAKVAIIFVCWYIFVYLLHKYQIVMATRRMNKEEKREAMLEKLRAKALLRGKVDLASLPSAVPIDDGRRLVRVFVEGYEDVAFWRGIFDHFTNPYLRFEISVPTRKDLPKGKKVLLSMADRASEEMLLCMDSDFDYLFDDEDEVSKQITSSPYMFHTYTYATENYLCYAPSLHNVCVKAVKNDTHIFDFERFMADYSRTIYPLFLWYVYSASRKTENVLPLVDFKAAVRIGYIDIEQNGINTIAWLERNVSRRVESLVADYPDMAAEITAIAERNARNHCQNKHGYDYIHYKRELFARGLCLGEVTLARILRLYSAKTCYVIDLRRARRFFRICFFQILGLFVQTVVLQLRHFLLSFRYL